MSYKGYVKGQKNTFLSLFYTFPWCPVKGMLVDFGTLLSVFIKKYVFICSLMAPTTQDDRVVFLFPFYKL